MGRVPRGTAPEPEALVRSLVDVHAATVPSTVASVLRAAGAWSLDSPATPPFDSEEYVYYARFATPDFAPGDAIVLGCEGLATIADVFLNGSLLFSSENMFVGVERRIDAMLRPVGEENELVLRFRALEPVLAQKRPRPRWRVPMLVHQQLRYQRTTLLGRTPGWSPPAPAVGPWRPVWLERRRALDALAVSLAARVVGERGVVEATVKATALGGARIDRVKLVVTHGEVKSGAALAPDAGGGFSGRVEISSPALWWPASHGAPSLYDASIELAVGDETVTVALGTVGFRTVSVDRGEDGEGFTLIVNGVRVFARGACWTPLDVVTLGATEPATAAAVAQVREAGMNVLRVSGTMVYESDAFYDACDREGVLVWQDFMFANMDYPESDVGFETQVVAEARQFLARVQARPALAVLCGNSEGEQQAAMWGAPRESWSPPVFHATLPVVAREACPDVPYWPSSAHGGAFPHEPMVGTTSYYGVGAYLRPLSDARLSEVRFASECLAFANVPEPSGLAAMPGGLGARVHHPGWKSRTPRDLGAGWDFDDVRDHYLRDLFGVDPLALRYADHDRYLALSRVVTGEVMARTFSEWRRRRSRTSGGIVWLLRDLWAGAGWGVIDAHGAPKAAYFALRRALTPLALSLTDEGQSGVFVHLVNDGPTRVAGTLEISLYRHGEIRVGGGARDVAVGPHEALELSTAAFLETFFDTSYAYRFGPPSHDLVVATLSNDVGAVLARGIFLPLGVARSRESDLGIVADLAPAGDAFELVVRARRFAQWVDVQIDGFAASDNHFHVLPGSEHRTRVVRTTAKGAPRGVVLPVNGEAPTKITVVAS